MLEWVWPWLALALPLPWLVRRLAPPAPPHAPAALRVPFLEDFEADAKEANRPATPWRLWAAALAWVLLVLAACRPQWVGDPVSLPVSGRDLMLAVDLSGSMAEKDFQLQGLWVDRLSATKSVVGDFLERRSGDRVGLILFGDRAYVQTPLTFDRETVRQLLEEAEIGLAGKATAIGDAIGLAVKRLRNLDPGQRVLILLTDGANTAGEVDPVDAASLAAHEGVKIYTIGVGADELVVRDFFGTRRINPSAELDEETLRSIARITEGRYFRARDLRELEQIYGLLDELEPVEQENETLRPREELYPWPLATALLICLAVLWPQEHKRGGHGLREGGSPPD